MKQPTTKGRAAKEEQALTKRAVIYLRVSTTKQVNKDELDPEGYSLPAQRESCIRKATQLGAQVVDEYADRGESAKFDDRPDFQRMLERIRRQRDVDFVIVDKVNRFARNRRDDANILFELHRNGAQLVSVKENIDSPPAGRLMHALLAGFAEYESANNGVEALKGMTQKAKTGGTPGRAPLGYLNVHKSVDGRIVRTVEVDPERAPLIQWAFEAYATGEWTIKALTAELTERGLRSMPVGTKPSQPLHWGRVAHTLNNRYYLGFVTFRGIEYPGRHEPLVTPQLFAQVQDVMQGRRYAGDKHRVHDHYLKGTVFCGKCHSRLIITWAKGKGGNYLYFFCRGRQAGNGCRQRYLQVDAVEDAVERFYSNIQLEPERIDRIREYLTEELANTKRLREREARRQRSRVERLVAEREKLLMALYADAVSMDLFKIEQARIGHELVAAEARLIASEGHFSDVEQSIHRALDVAGDLEAMYRAGSPTERRLLNQGIFECLWVTDGLLRSAKVSGATLTQPFAALLAHDLSEKASRLAESPEFVFSGVGSNMSDLVRPEGLEPPTF
ncbi:MAG TPA: recombinase family protein [Actinomycetota bacterium]|nr:recombinase family protein [Actinomycetota bacterium]